jgi:uncharacterized membrane protein YgdD (TMEM256/DUF423 family)
LSGFCLAGFNFFSLRSGELRGENEPVHRNRKDMKTFGSIGALACFIGVLAGALGSHGLQDHLVASGGLSNFNLATRYMFYIGLAMIVTGLAGERHPRVPFRTAGWLFAAGTLLFQGNLYLSALSGVRFLMFLTPVGGLCLMAGWLLLAYCALRART